jgi:tetratricopeptide (TPR) repeat protein
MVTTSYNNIRSVLRHQGDLEGAFKEYRKALEIEQRKAPNSLDVANSYNNIGWVLQDRGDLEGALKEFCKCLDIILDTSRIALVAFNPLLAICRYNLGETLASVKEFEEARKLATDIFDVLPDYKWAYLLLDRALVGLGCIIEAIDSYDKAISRSPNFSNAHAAKVEAEVGLRLSQTPGKEEGKADLDLILKQTTSEGGF